MSVDEEMQIGRATTRKILSSEQVERDTDRAARVVQIGSRIARVAERPDLQWGFYTIINPEINARAVPGGSVFMHTGMLEFIGDNDDELAAVVGHEIAHIVARHSAESISQRRVVAVTGGVLGAVAIVASIAAGGDPKVGSDAQRAVHSLADLGILLPYSRAQEIEADHIGAILMAKAGYDPRASATLWRRMAAESAGGRRRIALLSTHPLDETRIAALERVMPEALTYYRPGESSATPPPPRTATAPAATPAELDQQAIAEHNKKFMDVLRRELPGYHNMITNPNRRAEAQAYFKEVYAWIATKPPEEAARLREIAERGRNPHQIVILIQRFEHERKRGG
jgi:Zn-dependent protease with chaperone function